MNNPNYAPSPAGTTAKSFSLRGNAVSRKPNARGFGDLPEDANASIYRKERKTAEELEKEKQGTMQTLINLGTSDGYLKENYSPDDERQRPDAIMFREKLDDLRSQGIQLSPDALQKIMEESMQSMHESV